MADIFVPEDFAAWQIHLRRMFHRRPEIGWCEYWTTSALASECRKMGLAPLVGREIMEDEGRLGLPDAGTRADAAKAALTEEEGIPGADPAILDRMGACTGALVDLAPDREPGLVIRCDIDALPVRECGSVTHLPHASGFDSLKDGWCHACGHDGHMAIALGCIRLLAPMRTHLRRNIRFLFQPAEEGVRGAASLTGQVRGFPYFLGYHIGLSCRETGAFVAGVSGSFATTKFNLCFTGKEAHAAQSPEDGCDALKGACETVLALHALPRHSAGPGRVNVGVMTAGTGRNIVPGSARLECEVRGRPEEVSDFLFAGARRAAEGAALMNGLGLSVETVGHAGCMESDDALSSRMAALAEDFRIDGRPGFTRVIQKARGSASEDAATLMQAVQMGGGRPATCCSGVSSLPGTIPESLISMSPFWHRRAAFWLWPRWGSPVRNNRSGEASLGEAYEGVRELGSREIGVMQAGNGSKLHHVQSDNFPSFQTACQQFHDVVPEEPARRRRSCGRHE